MAKFTVYFKEKAIQSKLFDSGVVHIGRDEFNDLTIDNPTVAPAHAVILIKENNYLIKQLNDEFPLIINNEKCKEALLEHDDVISVGKHTITFIVTESVNENINNDTIFNKEVNLLNQKITKDVQISDANLQIMDGQHIGRMIPLKKSMTRFGHSGSGVVVIARRKEGYFISSLEGGDNITINNQTLDEKTINLNDNDIVIIDNISMQFFLEG